MNKATDSEKLVEQKLVELTKKNKGLCIKLLCDYITGLPDRLCLFPGRKIVFVETKTTNKKPRRIQLYMHKKIKSLGFRVEIIDSVAGAEQLISSILYEKE